MERTTKSYEYTETYQYIYEFIKGFKREKVKAKEIPKGLEVAQLVLLAQLIIDNNFDPVKIFDTMSEKDYNWAKKLLKKEKEKKYERLAHTVNTLLNK